MAREVGMAAHAAMAREVGAVAREVGAVAEEAAAEKASEAKLAGAVAMAAAAKRTVPMQSVPRPSVDSVVKAEQLARP